ncbi:hypothetical protein DMP23_21195 [Amycolatopsis sp. A1MSW2902]|uniref:SNF2-related protein n=1 Tax=Amycolatopsis sp. A1MSW2902 TaxID=687413 RepID=UPI00307D8A94
MNASVPEWVQRALTHRALSNADQRALISRIETDSLRAKDLYLLLFGMQDSAAVPPAVRDAAARRIGRQLNFAPSVLASYCLKRGLPSPVPDAGYGTPGPSPFKYRCSIDLNGVTINGAWAEGWTRKEAMQRSQLRLLERLAEAEQPAAPAPVTGSTPPVPPSGLPALEPQQFLSRIKAAARKPEAPQELLDNASLRARSGLLRHEDLEYLLLTVDAPGWTAVKQEGLLSSTRIKGTLPRLLETCRIRAGAAPLQWSVSDYKDGNGYFLAEVAMRSGRKLISTGPCQATNKQAAREAARTALLSRLLGFPPAVPSARDRKLLFATNSASCALNAAEMQGKITALDQKPDDRKQLPYAHQASCEINGRKIVVRAHGPSKKAAKENASRQLLLLVNQHLEQAPEPEPSDPVADAGVIRTDLPDATPAAAAGPAAVKPLSRNDFRLRTTEPAVPIAELLGALENGAELAFDVEAPPLTAELLCFGPAVDVLLRENENAVVNRWIGWRTGEIEHVRCGRTRLADLLPTLVQADNTGWSDSARVCAATARLAIEIIQNGFVLPGYSEGMRNSDRQPAWKIGPLVPFRQNQLCGLAERLEGVSRCLHASTGKTDKVEVPSAYEVGRTLLDVVADRFVRSPGSFLAFGAVPFAAPVTLSAENALLRPWTESIEDDADPGEHVPALAIKIEEPDDTSCQLRAILQFRGIPGSSDTAVDAISVWNGDAPPPVDDVDLRRQVCRMLRRGAGAAPALQPLADQPWPDGLLLSLENAATLRGRAGDALRAIGIDIEWHKNWLTDAVPRVVVASGKVDGRLGLGEILDRRWQLAVDDVPINSEELAKLTARAMPIVHRHNRWILLDNETRATLRKPLPAIPAAQAVLDVMDGFTTEDGRTFACTAEDGITRTIDRLCRQPTDAELDRLTAALHPVKPRPYQTVAVARIQRLAAAGCGALLADDMGIGKTLTCLAFHLLPGRPHRDRPTLVLVPNHATAKRWEDEADKHNVAVNTKLYFGRKRQLPDRMDGDAVIVTSYKMLNHEHDKLCSIEWGLVIADEAHKIKNPATFCARYARLLRAAMRIASTGTPMENWPGELWALFDWATPRLFGSCSQFLSRYARPVEEAATDAELGDARSRVHRATGPFMIRRMKDDPELGLELPQKVKNTYSVPLSRTQIGLLEAHYYDVKEQCDALPSSSRTGQLARDVCYKQQMICASPGLFEGQSPATILADLEYAETEAPKLRRTRLIIEAARTRNESTLIFVKYRSTGSLVAEYLTTLGYRVRLFNGETKTKDREQAIAELKDGSVEVLVIGIQCGGFGLDLPEARNVVHYERGWNPAVEEQANDRAYRSGQKQDVLVHYLIHANTLEEKITARLEGKDRLTRLMLCHDGQPDLQNLTPDQLTDLIRLNR